MPTFILEARRTPFGALGGSLKARTAPELAGALIGPLLAGLDPGQVEELILGQAVQAGEVHRGSVLGQAPEFLPVLLDVPRAGKGDRAEQGERLEELGLDRLVCRAAVQRVGTGITPGLGLIYAEGSIDAAEVERLALARPPFVAQALEFPLDEDVERRLCQAGVPSIENLVNTHLLPCDRTFLFVGLPLAIAGDGAPIRAVALLE